MPLNCILVHMRLHRFTYGEGGHARLEMKHEMHACISFRPLDSPVPCAAAHAAAVLPYFAGLQA